MRWRTVSGGGRAPEPVRLKRSGRPERAGFLERRSLGREEPRASTEGASTAGKKLDRDGFGRPGPARRLSPTAREKGRPAQLPRRKMPSGRHPKERQGPAFDFPPCPSKADNDKITGQPYSDNSPWGKDRWGCKKHDRIAGHASFAPDFGLHAIEAAGQNVLRFAEIILPGCATLPAGAGPLA